MQIAVAVRVCVHAREAPVRIGVYTGMEEDRGPAIMRLDPRTKTAIALDIETVFAKTNFDLRRRS
jgi:hypothetical protein